MSLEIDLFYSLLINDKSVTYEETFSSYDEFIDFLFGRVMCEPHYRIDSVDIHRSVILGGKFT